MFGRWERFDRQFYQPYLPHSSEVLQTDVKSDIFVAVPRNTLPLFIFCTTLSEK